MVRPSIDERGNAATRCFNERACGAAFAMHGGWISGDAECVDDRIPRLFKQRSTGIIVQIEPLAAPVHRTYLLNKILEAQFS